MRVRLIFTKVVAAMVATMLATAVAQDEAALVPGDNRDIADTNFSANYIGVFEAWRARARTEGFNAVEEQLLSHAAENSDPQSNADVAYFYFAMGLYPEAGGVIRSINENLRSADLLMLEAAASLKLRRWGEAAMLLSGSKLRDLSHVAPWRGIALAELGAFNEAAGDLLRTEHATIPFEDNAAHFYLARAQTALAIGHIDPALRALRSIDEHIETQEQRDRRRLLEARLQLARGADSAAVNSLNILQRDSEPPVSLHAEIDLIRYRQRNGALSISDGIDQLRTIGLRWSGGALERERLETEAALHEHAGNRIAAVAAQRKLLLRFPASDAARSAEKYIRTALASILTDKTVSPRDAARTFYENIELAPPGAEGDALIRDAVETLAGLDLLPEAAELLHHQVFKRLRGAERSEVAADLAALYLAVDDPSAAIEAIENTRRTRLPESIAVSRAILEADAHYQNGDPQRALRIVADRKTFDAFMLTGRIFAALGEHAKAGAAFANAALAEDGNAAQADAAILAAAAIAQSGDAHALQSLSEKIGGKIPAGPGKELFTALIALDTADNGDAFTTRYAAYFND